METCDLTDRQTTKSIGSVEVADSEVPS